MISACAVLWVHVYELVLFKPPFGLGDQKGFIKISIIDKSARFLFNPTCVIFFSDHMGRWAVD